MIEKLNTKYIHVESDSTAKLELANKINELVDTVNKLHEEAENNARIRANHENLIDTLVEENNVHEKQIDELQMRDEDLAERINYTLAKATGDKEALKLLDEKYKPVDKFAEQRKALKIAVDALKTVRRYTAINQFAPKSREAHIVAKKAVAEITALEQKE
jgi:hypothetical protein